MFLCQNTRTGLAAESVHTQKCKGEKIIFQLAVDAILILAPLIWLNRIDKIKKIPQWLGLFPDKPVVELVRVFKIFFVLVGISVAVSVIFYITNTSDLENVATVVKSIVGVSPFLLIYLLVVRVFAEELFFRGFLVQKIGVFGSSAAFALAHALYGSYTEIIGAFLLGWWLAVAFKRYNSIWANYIAHVLYNLLALMLIL